WVLASSIFIAFLLIIPKMEVTSPGKGIMAVKDGIVEDVTKTHIVVSGEDYSLQKHQ
ncbi:MAG: MFS transporter, partial [Flavobacteriales bacterium CG18_big_fil_WC_8_21_14_2_50_32_9]